MIRHSLLLSAVGLLVLFATPAYGCECVETSSRLSPSGDTIPATRSDLAKEWLNGDRLVIFSGRVTRIRRVGLDLEVTFVAARIWKGAAGQAVIVRTSQSGGGSCGFSFERHETYLIYASMVEGGLYTSVCTPTIKLRDAAEDLRVLGEGRVPAPAAPKHNGMQRTRHAALLSCSSSVAARR
jgi:hypothetical protein